MFFWGFVLLGLLSIWLFIKHRELQFKLSLSLEKIKTLEGVEKALKDKEEAFNALLLKERVTEEKLQFIKASEEHLKNTFSSLSQEALAKSQRSFFELAKLNFDQFQEKAGVDLDKKHHLISELLTPVKEGLTKLDVGLKELEKERNLHNN